MQPDTARKQAMMEELKHYINGKFAELEEKIMGKLSAGAKSAEPPKKAEREKAVRG